MLKIQIHRPRVAILMLLPSAREDCGPGHLHFCLAPKAILELRVTFLAGLQRLKDKSRIFFLFCMPPHTRIITQNKHRNACWWIYSSIFFKLSLSGTLQNKHRDRPMHCEWHARMEFDCSRLGANFLVASEL